MTSIENDHLQIHIQEECESFNIRLAHDKTISLTNNRIRIRGTYLNGARFAFSLHFRTEELHENNVLIYSGRDEASGIDWKVTFTLPAGQPFVLWKMELLNHTVQPIAIDEISLLEPGDRGVQNVIFPKGKGAHLAFYSNGWQTGSSSGAYAAEGRMRHSNIGILQDPIIVNPDTPKCRTRGRFSSDFFGVLGDLDNRSGLLLGFLSQKQHFGSLTADLRDKPTLRLWANGDGAHLLPGACISTDWAICCFMDIDDPHPLGPFLDAAAIENGVGLLPPAPAGWCSWYYYYENISKEIIRENLNQINRSSDRLPLELVQIDDGFEAQVGDWLEANPRFIGGMAPLAQEIRAAGLTPGLWLAPFILHPDARTAVENPGWLLRDKNGNAVRAGFGWNTFTMALDLTVPQALEYACEVVDTAVHHWGYPYLKLDFLYAAALKGAYHDPTRTRAQVLRGGMEALRRSAGDETFLLGCGAPLGSVLGLVQAMRIGADVSGSWRPFYFGTGIPFRNEPHLPCACNAIQNMLARAEMNRRWWVNDPDCLLVRPDSRLSLDEVRTLATAIGMTGGSVMLSDKMAALPQDRIEIAAALLPPIQAHVQVLDWLDAQTPQKLRLDLQGAAGSWQVLAYFNWQDRAVATHLRTTDFRLPEGTYHVRSFWDNRNWFAEGDELFDGELAPYAALLLAVRPYQAGKAAYLGSSLHISQGLEVKEWQTDRHSLSLLLSPERRASACVDLFIPHEIIKASFSGTPVVGEAISEHCYRFRLDIDHSGTLNLSY